MLRSNTTFCIRGRHGGMATSSNWHSQARFLRDLAVRIPGSGNLRMPNQALWPFVQKLALTLAQQHMA